MTPLEFKEWESTVFGYGYGTGEPYVLQALSDFLMNCPVEGTYDYREIENTIGAQVCWLLINVLGHADIIEYGTSPRFGWLTKKGVELRSFLAECGIEKALGIIGSDSDEEAPGGKGD